MELSQAFDSEPKILRCPINAKKKLAVYDTVDAFSTNFNWVKMMERIRLPSAERLMFNASYIVIMTD